MVWGPTNHNNITWLKKNCFRQITGEEVIKELKFPTGEQSNMMTMFYQMLATQVNLRVWVHEAKFYDQLSQEKRNNMTGQLKEELKQGILFERTVTPSGETGGVNLHYLKV